MVEEKKGGYTGEKEGTGQGKELGGPGNGLTIYFDSGWIISKFCSSTGLEHVTALHSVTSHTLYMKCQQLVVLLITVFLKISEQPSLYYSMSNLMLRFSFRMCQCNMSCFAVLPGVVPVCPRIYRIS